MQWDFLKFAMFTVFKSTTDLHLQGSEVRMTRYKTKPETVMANCAKVSFFILINEDQSSVFCWNGDDYDDPVDDDGDDEYDDYGDDEYDDDYDSGDFNRPPRFQWCCAHIGQGLEFWFARWWSVIIDHANDDHKDDHAEDNDKALDKFHTPLSHLSMKWGWDPPVRNMSTASWLFPCMASLKGFIRLCSQPKTPFLILFSLTGPLSKFTLHK